MTDKAATDLLLSLEAMRAARAEDHKTCARLRARVVELERLLRDGHVVTRHVDTHGIAAWRRHVESVVAPEDEAARLRRLEEPQLAEGTRDEVATRCADCQTPIASGRRCGPCAGWAVPR